jgi:hypothetical protein
MRIYWVLEMADGYKRFGAPIIFSAIGMIVAFWITQQLTSEIITVRPAYDLVAAVDGSLGFDVNFILMILIPIFILEFLIFTLPFAFFMLLIAKMFRMATYNIDVMPIGHGFDWLRIMKRAVIPALFALSLGELVISLLNGVIFWIPPMTDSEVRALAPTLHPLLTMFGALIALVISIPLFAPTWLLNDSGIVAHVKPRYLELRRCPDTEGVGRWYSNLIGGFGILGFPIAMFHRYFYQKFIITDIPLTFGNVMISLGWTVGLPFIVMAFILPIIIMNEFTIKWTANVMQRIARTMGATDVQFQRVERVYDGNLQDSAENSPPL